VTKELIEVIPRGKSRTTQRKDEEAFWKRKRTGWTGPTEKNLEKRKLFLVRSQPTAGKRNREKGGEKQTGSTKKTT